MKTAAFPGLVHGAASFGKPGKANAGHQQDASAFARALAGNGRADAAPMRAAEHGRAGGDKAEAAGRPSPQASPDEAPAAPAPGAATGLADTRPARADAEETAGDVPDERPARHEQAPLGSRDAAADIRRAAPQRPPASDPAAPAAASQPAAEAIDVLHERGKAVELDVGMRTRFTGPDDRGRAGPSLREAPQAKAGKPEAAAPARSATAENRAGMAEQPEFAAVIADTAQAGPAAIHPARQEPDAGPAVDPDPSAADEAPAVKQAPDSDDRRQDPVATVDIRAAFTPPIPASREEPKPDSGRHGTIREADSAVPGTDKPQVGDASVPITQGKTTSEGTQPAKPAEAGKPPVPPPGLAAQDPAGSRETARSAPPAAMRAQAAPTRPAAQPARNAPDRPAPGLATQITIAAARYAISPRPEIAPPEAAPQEVRAISRATTVTEPPSIGARLTERLSERSAVLSLDRAQSRPSPQHAPAQAAVDGGPPAKAQPAAAQAAPAPPSAPAIDAPLSPTPIVDAEAQTEFTQVRGPATADALEPATPAPMRDAVTVAPNSRPEPLRAASIAPQIPAAAAPAPRQATFPPAAVVRDAGPVTAGKPAIAADETRPAPVLVQGDREPPAAPGRQRIAPHPAPTANEARMAVTERPATATDAAGPGPVTAGKAPPPHSAPRHAAPPATAARDTAAAADLPPPVADATASAPTAAGERQTVAIAQTAEISGPRAATALAQASAANAPTAGLAAPDRPPPAAAPQSSRPLAEEPPQAPARPTPATANVALADDPVRTAPQPLPAAVETRAARPDTREARTQPVPQAPTTRGGEVIAQTRAVPAQAAPASAMPPQTAPAANPEAVAPPTSDANIAAAAALAAEPSSADRPIATAASTAPTASPTLPRNPPAAPPAAPSQARPAPETAEKAPALAVQPREPDRNDDDDRGSVDAAGPRAPLAQPAPAAQSTVSAPVTAVAMKVDTPSPAATVAGAIALEPSWKPATVASTTQAQTYRGPASPRTLQIQLNPGHLGAVQASMTMSGAQLEIEIRVESHEAMERLKGERHVIEQALRSLGYELAQVSITQSMIVSTPAARADPAAAPPPSGNGAGSQQADANSSSGGNRSNGQQAHRSQDSSGEAGRPAPRSVAGDRRGVYI